MSRRSAKLATTASTVFEMRALEVDTVDLAASRQSYAQDPVSFAYLRSSFFMCCLRTDLTFAKRYAAPDLCQSA